MESLTDHIDSCWRRLVRGIVVPGSRWAPRAGRFCISQRGSRRRSQRSIPFLRRLAVPAQVAASQLSQLWHRSPRPMPGIRFDRDLPVTMSDGARLMTNVVRPEPDGRYPVVMSVTPYGKDVLPDRIQM